MRLAGKLETQSDAATVREIKNLGISYDRVAAAKDQLLAAHAFIAESINILADGYARALSPEDLVAQRVMMRRAGNNHSDAVLRRYAMTDEGVTAFMSLITILGLFVLDFAGGRDDVTAKDDDEQAGLLQDGYATELHLAFRNLRERGMSESGIFAAAVANCAIDTRKHGASQTQLFAHLLQAMKRVVGSEPGQ